MYRITRTDLKSVKTEGVQSIKVMSLMSVSGSKVIAWINVMTSDGWEVKLSLVEREGEESFPPGC